jgi:hypothetical protein
MNGQWMKLNQDLLVVTLKVLETTELVTAVDIKLIISSVNYLYLMTDCPSWKALQKNMSTFVFTYEKII